MTWPKIGTNHLQAAKRTLDEYPRSAASRAYYAAHVLLTHALVAAGYRPPSGRQTPPHAAQAKLIGSHLAGMGVAVVRELKTAIRRLYARRIDADYRRTVTFDRAAALESIRDASTLFKDLEAR